MIGLWVSWKLRWTLWCLHFPRNAYVNYFIICKNLDIKFKRVIADLIWTQKKGFLIIVYIRDFISNAEALKKSLSFHGS